MNVIQVQNEPSSATCPHCGADVALDQRYCLACGRPCSPVRLAFLDVLQAESAQHPPGTIVPAPNGYMPAAPPDPGVARLGRYSGLFSLIAVLLLTGVIGLLIGHWISGGSSGSNEPRVYKIEGLGSTAAPTTEPTSTSEGATASEGKEAAATAKKSSAAKAKETGAEAKETSEAKLPEAVKPSKEAQEKLSKLTGKAYEKEIEKEVKGPEPIETE